MFFYNEGYIFIAIIGLILVFIPQLLVKNTFSKFAKVRSRNGMTGAQVAKSILERAKIYNVSIEPTEGTLSDHYDPSKKVIRLSREIYYGDSVASLSVAAHEVGHAIQDSQEYLPMKLRAGVFPLVNLGQTLGPLLIMVSIGLRAFMHIGGFTDIFAIIGILFYASVVLFHIITLPVEFNASARALKALVNGNYLEQSEMSGARSVLSAAAMTYVATALYAVIELLYWIWILFSNRGRD